MFKLDPEKTQIGIVFLLLTIVITVGFYALVYKPSHPDLDTLLGNLNSENFPIEAPTEESSTEILISDVNTIKFNNSYLVALNGWKVEQGLIGKTAFGITCTNAVANCPVYKITKDNISFYISPKAIQYNYSNKENLSYLYDLSIETSEGLKGFTYIQTTYYIPKGEYTADSPNVEVGKADHEIFGCLNSNLCVTSGILPSNPEENKLYKDLFNDLLKSINTK